MALSHSIPHPSYDQEGSRAVHYATKTPPWEVREWLQDYISAQPDPPSRLERLAGISNRASMTAMPPASTEPQVCSNSRRQSAILLSPTMPHGSSTSARVRTLGTWFYKGPRESWQSLLRQFRCPCRRLPAYAGRKSMTKSIPSSPCSMCTLFRHYATAVGSLCPMWLEAFFSAYAIRPALVRKR
jgi:hypothetical protein